MASNSNSIILIAIIAFIIVVLYLNFNSNNNSESFNNNQIEKPKSNKKIKIRFNKENKVKYFKKEESPSDVSNIKEESETNIEEFDYSENIPNLFRGLNINQNSNNMVSHKKIEENDTTSDKFDKLIGTVETDVNSDNLKLIQGKDSKNKSLNMKSEFIYNNSLSDDFIKNNNKYQPFEKNGYRSI